MTRISLDVLRRSAIGVLTLTALGTASQSARAQAQEPPQREPEPPSTPPAPPEPGDAEQEPPPASPPDDSEAPIEVTASDTGSATADEAPIDVTATADTAAAAPEAADEEAMEVTVVGVRRQRAPGAAYVIRKAALERTEYDDPHAVLQTVPGVYVRSEDGLGLRPNIGLRGAASDRSKKITLMEDGVLLGPAPYSAPAAYYFPLITRFTQVRVIKGPAAIAYGPQTVGGAIDFMTRSIPSTEAGEIDLAAGQYGYGKLHAWAGASTDRLGFVIEGAHLRNDGFKELPGGEDTGSYRNEVVFKGNYAPDPTARVPHDIGVKLSYSDELSNETYLGLTDADFRDDPLQRYGPSKLDQMRWHRTGISVTHRTRPIPKMEVATTVYRNDLSRTWRKVNRFGGASLFDVLTNPESPSNAVYVAILRGELDSDNADELLFIGPNQRDFVSQGVQTLISWETTTGPLAHRFEYGLRLHYDRVERHHTEDAFQVVGGDVIQASQPTVETAFNEAWTEAVAFHALDAITWGPLTVTPGIRAEVMRSALVDHLAGTEQRGASSVVLPGAGVFYSLTDAFGVLAGVYRGFSPAPPGSPETTGPELSVNYEAGARYDDGRAHVDLIGYYNDYSNLTDICTLSTDCLSADLDRQFAAGSARIYGVEANAAHDVPLGGQFTLPLSASYTLALTEFLLNIDSDDPIFGDFQAGDEIPYIPRHQAYVLVGVEHPTAGGYVSGTFVSAMREQAGSEPLDEVLSTDDQYTFDTGAYYRPLEWLKLYANVRNALDSQFLVSHRPYGARPNAPRWIQVGMKASF